MKDSVQRIQRLKKSLLIRGMFLKYFISILPVPSINEFILSINSKGLTANIQHYNVTGFTLNLEDNFFVEWNGNRIVICDLVQKKIIRVDDSKVYPSKKVLDLSDEGDRWEGDVLHGQPYGWGVLYDKEGEKAYEGFRIGSMSVCYGTQYYADIQKVEYQGEWCDGKRWGRGALFNREKNVVYNGVWVNDGHAKRKVVITAENEKDVEFCNKSECLEVGENCCHLCKSEELLKMLPYLKELIVGNTCFKNTDEVKLIDMDNLEKVVIGLGSFTQYPKDAFRNPNRKFFLKNCPNMKTLRIGSYSFSDFTVCEIENVPLLESISIGDLKENHYCYSFYYVASLRLRSVHFMMS